MSTVIWVEKDPQAHRNAVEDLITALQVLGVGTLCINQATRIEIESPSSLPNLLSQWFCQAGLSVYVQENEASAKHEPAKGTVIGIDVSPWISPRITESISVSGEATENLKKAAWTPSPAAVEHDEKPRCLACGMVFEPKSKKIKYCDDQACKKTRLRKYQESHKAKTSKTANPIPCAHCRELFTPKSSRSTHCDKPECKKAKWRENWHRSKKLAAAPVVPAVEDAPAPAVLAVEKADNAVAGVYTVLDGPDKDRVLDSYTLGVWLRTGRLPARTLVRHVSRGCFMVDKKGAKFILRKCKEPAAEMV